MERAERKATFGVMASVCLVMYGLLCLGLSRPALAVWYAYPAKEKGKVSHCVDTQTDMQATLHDLETQSTSVCQLEKGPHFQDFDFPVVCKNGKRHFFFQFEGQCLAFMRLYNKGESVSAKAFAPDSALSQKKWAYARRVCLGAFELEPLSVRQYEEKALLCSCISILVSFANSNDSENQIKQAREVCESLMGVDTGSKEGEMKVEGRQPPTQNDRIKKGDPYESIVKRLSKFSSKSFPLGNYLTKTYKDPKLLQYPDAGGDCDLHFIKGVLDRCSGCSERIFDCS